MMIDHDDTQDRTARDILARLASRRSCRDFEDVEIPRPVLAEILADGIEAPSSCNHQNWHFIVVTDPERRRLARRISGGNHHFEQCSALVYLTFQKGWTHGNFSIVQSVAGACYHMMLSAHLRGYDCIWNAGIGDHAALREMLTLPPIYELQGALAIGKARPSAPAMKAPRRPAEEVVSWETFSRPAASIYPARPADDYPFFAISNTANPFAEWNPRNWTWDQIADFRGYAVWAKSPLAGVYVSRRQGEAQEAEHALIPAGQCGTVVEVMPWGGTSTVRLRERLPQADLHVAELSEGNISFIRERMRREMPDVPVPGFDLMVGPSLPYEAGSVDCVILPQVLEHMPDPEAVLAEVARVLAPGGTVIASIRNMESAYGTLWSDEESRAQIPNQGPFTPIPAATVRDWIAGYFDIEEEYGIGIEATSDATILTGDDAQTGRLYAIRGRLRPVCA